MTSRGGASAPSGRPTASSDPPDPPDRLRPKPCAAEEEPAQLGADEIGLRHRPTAGEKAMFSSVRFERSAPDATAPLPPPIGREPVQDVGSKRVAFGKSWVEEVVLRVSGHPGPLHDCPRAGVRHRRERDDL